MYVQACVEAVDWRGWLARARRTWPAIIASPSKGREGALWVLLTARHLYLV